MLCSRSFPGWGRELSSTYFDNKGGQLIQKELRRAIVTILWWNERYLNATINRTTWNAKQEIWHDRNSQTWRNPQVDGYGAGYRPPRSSASGHWTVLEMNWTVVLVQIQTTGRLPWPLANTTYYDWIEVSWYTALRTGIWEYNDISLEIQSAVLIQSCPKVYCSLNYWLLD